MALSDYEKAKILDALDRLTDSNKLVVLASLDAFSEWLAKVLYVIYLKVQNSLGKLWQWLKAKFS
jgi:hypothetical protein